MFDCATSTDEEILSLQFIYAHEDEWTGEQKLQQSDVPEDIELEEICPWETMPCPQSAQDRFNQATRAFLLCNIRIDRIPHFRRGWSVI